MLEPIDASQARTENASVSVPNVWDGTFADAHEELGVDLSGEGGLQRSPDLDVASEHEAIDLGEDEEPAPQVKDLFGVPVAEADAFDELTAAQMFQGRGS